MTGKLTELIPQSNYIYMEYNIEIQQYNQLKEVQKAYLEEMMKGYLQLCVDKMEDSDANVEADNEMHSDED
ncbi:hypothetical protein FRC11_011564 [Ceratobasidium sp. 423]|nr:hypothetical protein FRC11_011564 [Ceratobasidium sp. 423]